MGKCFSKPNPELENKPMLENKRTYSGEQASRLDFKLNSKSSVEDETTIDALHAGGRLNPLRVDLDALDVDYKYKLGIFYDNDISMWFRLIFVLENDITRKQFLSFYGLNLKCMDKEEFQNWCDKKGYPKTRDYYDFFKLLDSFPYSRLLNGLSDKYNVKFHISDLFLYKGKGPFRAITCCAHHHTAIDRALNEYESRVSKKKVIYNINKHWDNHIFPDPTEDSRDYSLDFPFSWPKHIRPGVSQFPKWPFDYSKVSPSIFRKLINDSKISVSDDADFLKSYGVHGNRKLNHQLKFPDFTVSGSELQTENKSVKSADVKQFFEVSEHNQ